MSKKWVMMICFIIGFLFLAVTFGSLDNARIYAASFTYMEEDGTQVICTADKDEVFRVMISNSGELKIIGKHVANSSSLTAYRTVGFTFTAEPANQKITDYMSSGKKYYSLRYDAFPERYVSDEVYKGEIVTTYTFPASIIRSIVNKLGYSWSDLGGNGIKIYINNIFRVVKRKSPGAEFTFADQKAHLDYSSISKAAPWSAATMERLTHYYDMKVTLRINTYAARIDFVDDSGTTLKSKLVNQNLSFGETYSIGFEHELKSGEDSYYFKGIYTQNYANGKKEKGSCDNLSKDEIEMKHTENADVIIQLHYKKNEKEDKPVIIDQESYSYVGESYFTPFAEGEIKAENRNAELYSVEEGVPGNEGLYIQFFADQYLLAYRFVRKTGVKTYSVTVNKRYHLNWQEKRYREVKDDEGNIIELIPYYVAKSDSVTVQTTENIPRKYDYWEIEGLDYYTIKDVLVQNPVLPGGEIRIEPSADFYHPPKLEYYHSSKESHHLEAPKTEIWLPEATISGGNSRPEPSRNLASEADKVFGQIKVRNDTLTIDGKKVLSDAAASYKAPAPKLTLLKRAGQVSEDTLYKKGLIIAPELMNGVYSSSAALRYQRTVSLNSKYNAELTYAIPKVNHVKVHTPVVCAPSIDNQHIAEVQLLYPNTKCIPLVLDESGDRSVFTVSISNLGSHSEKKGYQKRDFSKTLRDPSLSYLASSGNILRNEVCFPFDVFRDIGMDESKDNDILVPAGTWVIQGRESGRYYLPIWVTEGEYKIEFRSVAINCPKNEELKRSENTANRNINHYVATASIAVQVSGRLYGLSIYDVLGNEWKGVFGHGFQYTTGGINAFPMIYGSHPIHKNLGTLKLGYLVRFSLKTIGGFHGAESEIAIIPKYYFQDLKSGDRTEVDLYYIEAANEGEKSLKKMGSGERQLLLREDKRSYTNEFWLKYKNKEIQKAAAALGRTESTIQQKKQNWYGSYRLPSATYAVPKGMDVYKYAYQNGLKFNENFWKKNGFIIIQFDIKAKNGNKNNILSYLNLENYQKYMHCSMWLKEGGAVSRTDYYGNSFKFMPGDFLLYDSQRLIQEDYLNEGTH